MKKLLVTSSLLFMTMMSLHAQKKSENQSSPLAVSLGAAVTYNYGPGDRNFDKFENDRVNWQITGLMGLTLLRDKNGRRTMIAGFGNFGFNNESTLKNIFSDQDYTSLDLSQSASNNFYQLEGGLLISDILRVSTGVGQQNFEGQTLIGPNGIIKLNKKFLKYNSTTVGFNFNLTAIAVNVNVNFAHGMDYDKTIITPSAGLMLRL